MQLEQLVRGAQVKGVVLNEVVTVADVQWYAGAAVDVTYRTPSGNTGSVMLYRDRERTLELVEPGFSWSVDSDGERLRLASEAYRIQLAYLFDPMLAVHTSLVEPLPHQITAAYEAMLSRHADDPGAGKTIVVSGR